MSITVLNVETAMTKRDKVVGLMGIPLKQVEKKLKNMFGQNYHKGFRVAFIFFIKPGVVNT